MNRRGFTMIEVMLVIVVGGLLMVLGLPRLRTATIRAELGGARNAVASQVARARAASVEMSRATRVVVVGNRVAVVSGVDTIGPIQDLSAQFGATVSTAGDVGALGFDPRGFGTNTASATITATRSGYTKSLVILPYGRLQP